MSADDEIIGTIYAGKDAPEETFTVGDVRRWIRDTCKHLGCSWDELAEMNRIGEEESGRHFAAWVELGHYYGVYEPAEEDD